MRKFLILLAALLLLSGCAEVPEETVPEYVLTYAENQPEGYPTVLTAGELAQFRQKIEPLYEQYCGEYMDMVEQIRNG